MTVTAREYLEANDEVFGQLALDTYVPASRRPGDEPERESRPLDVRYSDWRRSPNGHAIYTAVLARAIRLRRAGWHHYGIGAICEAVRFAHDLRVGPDGEGFILNNSYRSRMAREIMASVPELDGFFEIRRLRS